MKKEMSNSVQMTINMLAAIVSFGVMTGINFFLTPYLVRELGSDAYGFIGLANNFVSYATILTSALNSMAGRFVSIEFNRGNIKKASSYFSSVLVANLIMAAVLAVVGALVVINLDVFLNIPENLVNSVKLTFALTFVTFIISIITAIFVTSTFVKNKLYINSIRDIIANLLKITIVVLLFTFLTAKLYFLAMASLASGLFLLVANISVKKKILPEIKLNFRDFDFRLVKNIISSGIWNSVSNLSNVLITGLDLLITNLAIGEGMMGLLSISVTVPNCVSMLLSTIAGIFTPRFTILYAKNQNDTLVAEAQFSQKIVSVITTVPLAGFMAFGLKFYTLWQPTKSPEEIRIIQILSLLACISYLATCHTKTLYSLFTVCNKLRANVLVSLGIGLSTVLIVMLLINFTPLGVYAVAGVSSVLISIKATTFIPLYSAHILKVKKSTFFPAIIRGWLCFLVIFGLFYLVNLFTPTMGWMGFAAVCLCCAVVGYAVSFPLILSVKEMKQLRARALKKFKKT